MATKKYLDYNGLSNVAERIKERLQKVSTMPASPANGDAVLYVGATTSNYKNGFIYIYDSSLSKWVLKADEWTEEKILNVGDTTVTFTGLDKNYAYEAFFECAMGYAPPILSAPLIFNNETGATTASATAVFSAVTELQAGGASGTECKISLQIIK